MSLQLAPGRLAEPAVRDFLKSVTEGKDKEVATDPRRCTVIEPPPFTPQVFEAERAKAIDLALARSCVHPSHAKAAGGAEIFGFDLDGCPAVTR